MKTIYQAGFAFAILVLSGCSPAPSSAPVANNPSPAPVASSPTAPATEDLTLPDVKLVKVEFTVSGNKYSMEVPEGSEVRPGVAWSTSIVINEDTQLTVRGPSKFDQAGDENHVAKETKWWKDGGGLVKPKRYLIEEPNTLLVESMDLIDPAKVVPRRYVMMLQKEFDGKNISVIVERKNGGGVADRVSTKEECLLAIKCAKTLEAVPPAE